MVKEKRVVYDDSFEPHEREYTESVKAKVEEKRVKKAKEDASVPIPDSKLTALEIWERDEAERVVEAAQTKFQVSKASSGRRYYVRIGTLAEFLEWVNEQGYPVIVDSDCDERDGTWHLQIYDEDNV